MAKDPASLLSYCKSVTRIFTLLIMCGLVLSACTPYPKTLRVGAAPWPGFEPVFLAKEMEYLDSERISLFEMTTSSHVMLSFEAGQLDVAFLSLDEVITLISRGLDLKVVAILDESNGGDAIVGLPGLTTLDQLKGKRIGYENNAAGALLLAEALSRVEVSAKDIELVEVKLDEHKQAFTQEQVDALISSEPIKQTLLSLGGNNLFDSAQFPGRIVNLMVVSTQAERAHSDALVGLLKGYYKARKFQKGRPQKAIQLMAMRLQLYTRDLAQSFEGVNFIEPVESLLRLSGAPSALNIQAEELGALMVRRGMLKQAPELDKLVSSRILERVIYE